MATLIQESDIHSQLGDGWRYDTEKKMITKEYLLADFGAAVGFISAIEPLANAADHHPDILLHGYRKVRVMLSTHSAGGITANDINLAKEIDAL
jgi:4a-hydroxytetrahydrobiopterin dehydratase